MVAYVRIKKQKERHLQLQIWTHLSQKVVSTFICKDVITLKTSLEQIKRVYTNAITSRLYAA